MVINSEGDISKDSFTGVIEYNPAEGNFKASPTEMANIETSIKNDPNKKSVITNFDQRYPESKGVRRIDKNGKSDSRKPDNYQDTNGWIRFPVIAVDLKDVYKTLKVGESVDLTINLGGEENVKLNLTKKLGPNKWIIICVGKT